jgi:CheY-like chemotaxis protein
MNGTRPSLRVLVVDDDATIRESLALLVVLAGHDACAAPDGLSALALAARYRPQVVLVDAGMPGMNGWDVARRLRADARLRGAYIVCVTGYAGEGDRRRSADAGCDDHWVKPFEPDRLRELLASLRASEVVRIAAVHSAEARP